MYLLSKSVPIKPISGIKPCKIPIVIASAREFFILFFLKISPCEKDTTKQSTPSAILKRISSIKCKFLPQIIFSMEICTLYCRIFRQEHQKLFPRTVSLILLLFFRQEHLVAVLHSPDKPSHREV